MTRCRTDTSKRVALLGLVVALVMTGLVGGVTAQAATTGPASAGAAARLTPATLTESQADVLDDPTCEATFLCFWTDANFNGPRGRVAGNNTDWRVFPQDACPAANWNNCASSAKNSGTQCVVTVYDGFNFQGFFLRLPRGALVNFINNSFDNAVSSNRWC